MRTSIHFFICYVFTVFLFLNFVNSQTTSKLDSLIRIVEKERDDTTKIRTLLLISGEYSKTDPVIAMDYTNQALNLASNLKFVPGSIDAMIEKSTIYSSIGQLDSALFHSQNAIFMSEAFKDERRKAASYYAQASNLIRKGGPSAAREYYFKAHHLYKKIGDSAGYMNSLNGLGIVYYSQAEYDSAIYYYIEFLRLCEKLKNEEGLGKGYVNLGTSYYELKDFKNARHYFNESIKVNEKYNNLRFLSIANNNLGSMAFDENNLIEAMYYYTLSQEQNIKINNVFGLAQTKKQHWKCLRKKKRL
jgi:tetratricopeptide (TPR) repeat protein